MKEDTTIKWCDEKPPSLCNSNECVGCGESKTHRGKPVSSIICCNDCWKKIPKWIRDQFIKQASMEWENRIASLLVWLRETN